MKILHVTCSINPARGGLSAYLGALVPALNELGHPSEIASLDAPAAAFLAASALPVHALGPPHLGYAYAPRFLPWLRQEAARFDAVIVHGLWQYHGLAVHRALARPEGPPFFIFPHGMLDPWFNRRYPLKHLKKWLYWWPVERRILRDAAGVLFTCDEERRLARQSFAGGAYRERVVAFGTAAPPGDAAAQCAACFERFPVLRHPYWLFLGRIHPKKGVDLLLAAYAALATTDRALPHLVIAGPGGDPAYLRKLQGYAATACPPGVVHWVDMLTGDVKWGALRAAEAFVLPSHQENFGIAVAEALACGTPVLISDQVNIWREMVADGAGLVEPATIAGTTALLKRWQALGDEARDTMGAAARRSFQQRYEIGAVARSLVDTLQAVLPFRLPS